MQIFIEIAHVYITPCELAIIFYYYLQITALTKTQDVETPAFPVFVKKDS